MNDSIRIGSTGHLTADGRSTLCGITIAGTPVAPDQDDDCGICELRDLAAGTRAQISFLSQTPLSSPYAPSVSRQIRDLHAHADDLDRQANALASAR